MSFSTLKCSITLLRPIQWLKNLMIFFPPFLGGTMAESITIRALFPFLAFCLASSSSYIFNDILDRRNDSHHPQKKHRPLPSGLLSVSTAGLLSVIILLSGVAAAWQVSVHFTSILLIYVALSVAYSLKLKEFPLLDIFFISAGFLLRLEAGGTAFGVSISEWLFLSVFLLSIFLSTGKRLGEKKLLGSSATSHRKSLAAYPQGFLDGVMYMSGGAVLVTYTMYVISRHTTILIYTVPLCYFGLLRYMLRIQMGCGGDPTESLTKDVPLFVVGVLWVLLVGWGIYHP